MNAASSRYDSRQGAAKRARGGKGSGSYRFGLTKQGPDEREQAIIEWFRLLAVFSVEDHAAFEVTWHAYQDIIDAYQADKPAEGKKTMIGLMDTLKSGLPDGLKELRILGCTLNHRREDVLAYFDHPGTSK